IDLKTLMALEGVDVSPGAREYQVASIEYQDGGEQEGGSMKREAFLKDGTENTENMLTISPLAGRSPEVGKSGKTESKKHLADFRTPDFRTENALGMAADTGPVAKASRWVSGQVV
ncbi:hypothetical protein, partial [Mucilaginibacter sp. PPCGB 2223]|uniref:hypothetical protein n=1 Tax=Mucilaginibacter sp. PPCGB 2223 TaxID=1886027 RepID=UPI001586EB8F